MKSYLKQCIKNLPYLKSVFLERDQLRIERDELKRKIGSRRPVPWHFHSPDSSPVIDSSNVIDIYNPQCWKQYVPEFNKAADIGIREIAWTIFEVRNPTSTITTKSMLSIYELALLYMLGKDYYSGSGEIVDLGPLLGASTNAFARGLLDNHKLLPPEKYKRIYSFDLFHRQNYEHFIDRKYASVTNSLFDSYLQVNGDFLSYITINPGDFFSMKWESKNIEILFIDMAKSWELNYDIIKKLFPSLIPGVSIVIQQDYIHFYEYWVHVTMEYFHDYFEPLYMMKNASAVYRYVKEIPDEVLRIDPASLPLQEKLQLIERARERAPEPVQEVMKAGHARLLYDLGDYEGAAGILSSVDFNPKTSDPVLEVSATAKANAEEVRKALMLKLHPES